MDPITPSTLNPAAGAAPRNSFDELGSDDFLRLLIAQLTTQDPLEPTGNEELLRQISSIRDIELSTSLTRSLQSLTGGQNFSSASALIGQYVTGIPGADGAVNQGVVMGIRFEGDGRPILQLSSGAEVPLTNIAAVQPALQAGEALMGQTVTGVDRRNPADPKLVEGLVTAARSEAPTGEVILELDTGDTLRLRDFITVVSDE